MKSSLWCLQRRKCTNVKFFFRLDIFLGFCSQWNMSTLDDIERKHKNYLNNEMAQMCKPQKRVNIFVWWIADDKKKTQTSGEIVTHSFKIFMHNYWLLTRDTINEYFFLFSFDDLDLQFESISYGIFHCFARRLDWYASDTRHINSTKSNKFLPSVSPQINFYVWKFLY